MEQEVLVQVEGLSKKFCKSLKKSLRYGVHDLAGSLVGKKPTDTLRKDEFWALKDINFELRRGECLGLIGHNGAGKSTLLKILNGLINPDQGKVTLRGRVGALIELGAGFNPILSGRENIYNNGAVLGFTKREIDNKLEDIIDFAEIREFIDMPVQNYSSGMKVRLGFAVAAQMEPDVLIIDEVLAVGDVGFKVKCFNVLEELLKKTAVILVTHNMPQIARICNKLLLLNNGRIQVAKNDHTNIAKGIEKYYSLVGWSNKAEIGNPDIKINPIKLNGIESEVNVVDYASNLNIQIGIKNYKGIQNLAMRLNFFDAEQKPVAQISSMNDGYVLQKASDINLEVIIERVFLNVGLYTMHIILYEINNKGKEGEVLKIIRSAINIKIVGNDFISQVPCLLQGNWKSSNILN